MKNDKTIDPGPPTFLAVRSKKIRATSASFFYLCSSVFICGSHLGCSGYAGPRSIVNVDPAVKIPEIKRAADANDRSAIPQLVKDLDSDDAAVRFYAIEALDRLTGGRRDYDWTVADRHERAPMIARWQEPAGEVAP